MKRTILAILLSLAVIAPGRAQSRKVVKQAKKDTKIEVKYLKSEGYKSLDNIKLEDAVNGYLTSKYATKNAVEVIGKATDKDLNVAKTEARSDALYGYPDEDVVDSFFVYKKTRGKYEVICYAALTGRSAKDASKDRTQSRRRSEGTEVSISSVKAEQKAQEAKAKEKKEVKQAKAKEKKARKKAEKAAEKANR